RKKRRKACASSRCRAEVGAMSAVPRLAPSDAARPGAEGRVEIAGRVERASGRAVTLADAFATVRVALAAESPLAPGDLAIVEGTLSGGEISGARVVERIVPVRPPTARAAAAELPASETDRLQGRGVGPLLAARARALAAI